MNGELERFLEAVKTDPELQEMVKSKQTVAEIVEEAKERGYELSESDLTAASEAGTGGSAVLGRCECHILGYGSNEDDKDKSVDYHCDCIFLGGGSRIGDKEQMLICDCTMDGYGWQ